MPIVSKTYSKNDWGIIDSNTLTSSSPSSSSRNGDGTGTRTVKNTDNSRRVSDEGVGGHYQDQHDDLAYAPTPHRHNNNDDEDDEGHAGDVNNIDAITKDLMLSQGDASTSSAVGGQGFDGDGFDADFGDVDSEQGEELEFEDLDHDDSAAVDGKNNDANNYSDDDDDDYDIHAGDQHAGAASTSAPEATRTSEGTTSPTTSNQRNLDMSDDEDDDDKTVKADDDDDDKTVNMSDGDDDKDYYIKENDDEVDLSTTSGKASNEKSTLDDDDNMSLLEKSPDEKHVETESKTRKVVADDDVAEVPPEESATPGPAAAINTTTASSSSNNDSTSASADTEDITSPSPSSSETCDSDNDKGATHTATATEKRKLNDQELLDVTDKVFGEAELESFTMKHIFNALVEKQGGLILTKKQKLDVRSRVQYLLAKQAETEVEEDGQKDDGDDEEEDDGSESSIAASEQGDEMSEYEEEEDDGDNEDESGRGKTGRRRNTKSTRKDNKSKTMSKSTKKKRPTSSSKKPSSERKAARAARMLEQQRLRKKRMEELRIRNEEMMLNQSKEDQERQDAIAAKFETNTDELRMKRLEDRLDLLQRLDEKRISVVASIDVIKKEPGDTAKSQDQQDPHSPEDQHTEEVPAAINTEESDSSDESSDEEDLVIVGMTKPFKPLKKLHNHLPSRGISILDQIQSPTKNKMKKKGTVTVASANMSPAPSEPVAPTAGRAKKADGLMMSPNGSMGARFALMNALKQKQRSVGNRWLARELGYKSELDHLKDCQTAAAQKRELVIRLEQERLKANERKNLRERILLEEAKSFGVDPEEENEDDEEWTPQSENPNNENRGAAKDDDEGEEDDEEMEMAKEIEKQAKNQSLQDTSPNLDEDSTSEAEYDFDERGTRASTESSTPDDIEDRKDTAAPSLDSSSEHNNERQPFERHSYLETQPLEQLTQTSAKLNTTSMKADVDVEIKSHKVDAEEKQLESQPPLETELPAGVSTGKLEESGSDSNNTDEAEHCPKEPRRHFDIEDDVDGNTDGFKDESKDEHKDDEKDDKSSDASNASKIEDTADDDEEEDKPSDAKPNRPRNAGWQAMLQREAEKLKKMKLRNGDLVEEEAEEEEEEEVAGLEDFGFTVSKKKKDDDDEDSPDLDKLDEDDLEHVVDDLSDDEGDEDAGREARKLQEQREEKQRHKEMLRRMREGYDGRRGGIAGSGSGARGMHRFDELVAADNREDAKRLGLLNDDELDSDDEGSGGKGSGDDDDEEEDEAALVDKMLKDRHLHRTDVDFEEEFSDDDEGDNAEQESGDGNDDEDDDEQRCQDMLAKRFAKRARMQRLEEIYGESQEFSQRRLIDEDESMKEELSQMRNGLVRRRSISSTISRASLSSDSNMGPPNKKSRGSDSDSSILEVRKSSSLASGSIFRRSGGSLSIALQASRKTKRRSTFLGCASAEIKEGNAHPATITNKSAAVVFSSQSNHSSKFVSKKAGGTSLFSRVSAGK